MNSKDPSMNTVSSSFAEQALQKYGNITSEIRQVPINTLENIIRNAVPDVNEIDFLTVDVEGYDYEVLTSNNWEVIRPKVVLVEINGGFENLQQCPVTKFLMAQNYTMIAYICLNREVGNGFFMKNEFA
jgi:hypothetical protein